MPRCMSVSCTCKSEAGPTNMLRHHGGVFVFSGQANKGGTTGAQALVPSGARAFLFVSSNAQACLVAHGISDDCGPVPDTVEGWQERRKSD